MVTHDPRLAAHADRIVFLKDGAIVDETRLADDPDGRRTRGAGSDVDEGERFVRQKVEDLR